MSLYYSLSALLAGHNKGYIGCMADILINSIDERKPCDTGTVSALLL